MSDKLTDILYRHTGIISFLLGSLAVRALPPFYQWYFLFFCFSGLLLMLNNAQTAKKAFLIGWGYGCGFFAFGLLWIGNALLVDAAQTGWLVPIVFLASGCFLGLFTGIPALLTYLSPSLYSRFLALGSWFVIFEWIRSWILTGFPWNLWGSCLAFSPELIQIASVLGTYGLSLFVILSSAAPALWLYHKTKKSALISLIFLFMIPELLFGYGKWRLSKLSDPQSGDITIRLVQPSISQTEKWSPELKNSHFKKYIDLSRSQPLDNIDMVIWGETASPYHLDIEPEALNEITQAISNKGYLTTGVVRFQDNYYGGWQPLNSSFVIDKKGNIEASYDKTHLVPFGEYIPLRRFLPDFIKPVTNTISDFKAGTGPQKFKLPNLPTFGIQICYEIIFPHQIINPSEKPDWILNLTNDAWYGISAGPYQHMVNACLRAVEEGITIVRSANSGISGVIDRTGQIISSLDLNVEGILDVTLPQHLTTDTIYNRFGNLPILILCFSNILFIYLFKILKQK